MDITFQTNADLGRVCAVVCARFPGWKGEVSGMPGWVRFCGEDDAEVEAWLDANMATIETLPEYNPAPELTIEERMAAVEDAVLSIAIGG